MNKKGRHSAIKVASYQPQLPREYELSMKVGCLLELLTFILLVRNMKSLFSLRSNRFLHSKIAVTLIESISRLHFDRKGVSRKISRGEPTEKRLKNSKKVQKIAPLNLFQRGGQQKKYQKLAKNIQKYNF